MDYNYNRIVLEQYLNKLFDYILKEYGENELKKLFNDLIAGKESGILNKNIQNELNKYSKDTIRLIIEKNILFSLENSVVNIKKTYWKVLKDRIPRMNCILLSHYYEKYIELLKNKPTIYNSETIEELNENYNKEITKSMMLNQNFDEIIKNTSSFNLNHMENLNANGRTISINGKRKGGIFLSKESVIGYGNFINKDDFLKKIKNTKIYKVTNNGTISSDDLKEIVNNIEQKISISKTEKNTIKSVIDSKVNRKTGNLFLGKDGIDLPNGEYVSVEELSLAINKFVTERNRKAKKNKIIKIKGMLKVGIAAASLAISLLTSAVSTNSKENIQSNIIQYDADDLYSQNNKKISAKVVTEAVNSVNNLINDVDDLKLSEINNNDLSDEENNKIETENLIFDEKPIEKNNEDLLENNSLNEESSNLENLNQNTSNEEISDNINDVINKQISNDINEDIKVSNDSIEQLENDEVDNDIEKEQNQVDNTLEENELTTKNDNSELNVLNLDEEEIPVQEVKDDFSNDIVSLEEKTTEINGNDIANYAVQFVGNPYVYGGTNLTDGTDCSGFTQSVYSNFGIDIARDSSSQINSGTNIGTNIEEAIPGDLLCFNGHVGIYIGDGQMVHAANAKRGIVINDVDYDNEKTLKAIVRPNGVNQMQAKTR